MILINVLNKLIKLFQIVKMELVVNTVQYVIRTRYKILLLLNILQKINVFHNLLPRLKMIVLL